MVDEHDDGGGGSRAPAWRLGDHILPFAGVTLAIYLFDQITKLLVVTNLRLYESIPDSGLLRLTHVTNTGSAFGLLRGQTEFLILVSIIGVLGVLFYYRANGRQSALLRYSLALLLGGALGNLTDRVLRGAVVDFISVQVWTDYHFPTFNIADAALTVGLFALAFYVLRNRATEKALEKRAATTATAQLPPSEQEQETVPSTSPLEHTNGQAIAQFETQQSAVGTEPSKAEDDTPDRSG